MRVSLQEFLEKAAALKGPTNDIAKLLKIIEQQQEIINVQRDCLARLAKENNGDAADTLCTSEAKLLSLKDGWIGNFINSFLFVGLK